MCVWTDRFLQTFLIYRFARTDADLLLNAYCVRGSFPAYCVRGSCPAYCVRGSYPAYCVRGSFSAYCVRGSFPAYFVRGSFPACRVRGSFSIIILDLPRRFPIYSSNLTPPV
jgi:hypothetical protein